MTLSDIIHSIHESEDTTTSLRLLLRLSESSPAEGFGLSPRNMIAACEIVLNLGTILLEADDAPTLPSELLDRVEHWEAVGFSQKMACRLAAQESVAGAASSLSGIIEYGALAQLSTRVTWEYASSDGPRATGALSEAAGYVENPEISDEAKHVLASELAKLINIVVNYDHAVETLFSWPLSSPSPVSAGNKAAVTGASLAQAIALAPELLSVSDTVGFRHSAARLSEFRKTCIPRSEESVREANHIPQGKHVAYLDPCWVLGFACLDLAVATALYLDDPRTRNDLVEQVQSLAGIMGERNNSQPHLPSHVAVKSIGSFLLPESLPSFPTTVEEVEAIMRHLVIESISTGRLAELARSESRIVTIHDDEGNRAVIRTPWMGYPENLPGDRWSLRQASAQHPLFTWLLLPSAGDPQTGRWFADSGPLLLHSFANELLADADRYGAFRDRLQRLKAATLDSLGVAGIVVAPRMMGSVFSGLDDPTVQAVISTVLLELLRRRSSTRRSSADN